MPPEDSDHLAYEQVLADEYAHKTDTELTAHIMMGREATIFTRGLEAAIGVFAVAALYEGDYAVAGLATVAVTGLEISSRKITNKLRSPQAELRRRSRQER